MNELGLFAAGFTGFLIGMVNFWVGFYCGRKFKK